MSEYVEAAHLVTNIANHIAIKKIKNLKKEVGITIKSNETS